MLQKIISCALSPNTEREDIRAAWLTLFTPWLWKRGSAQSRVTQWFQSYYPGWSVSLFNSGRSALLAILRAFDIGKGDEVLIQAFTCVAVPNSVLWAGAKPVFADIDTTYNLDVRDAERKITPRTRAMIVQHTFGIPARMDELAALCRKHKLLLIEDCAHSLGAAYKGKKVGSMGDAAFFSFGRDKVVSSVWGGAAIVRSTFKAEGAKLKEFQASLPMPGFFWIFQQLFHPIAFSFILILYDVVIGKILLVVLQKLRLLSLPVFREEKRGVKPEGFPAQYPNALAILLVRQLAKLDRYNQNRSRTAKYYDQILGRSGMVSRIPFAPGASYLRYPVTVESPVQYRKSARKRGILLGNWYHNSIDPGGVDMPAIGYRAGSCPAAEKAGRHILNLPTRITQKEASRVAEIFV